MGKGHRQGPAARAQAQPHRRQRGARSGLERRGAPARAFAKAYEKAAKDKVEAAHALMTAPATRCASTREIPHPPSPATGVRRRAWAERHETLTDRPRKRIRSLRTSHRPSHPSPNPRRHARQAGPIRQLRPGGRAHPERFAPERRSPAGSSAPSRPAVVQAARERRSARNEGASPRPRRSRNASRAPRLPPSAKRREPSGGAGKEGEARTRSPS